jgi:hypothetical protein
MVFALAVDVRQPRELLAVWLGEVFDAPQIVNIWGIRQPLFESICLTPS